MNRGSERRGGEGREWKVCERTLRGAIVWVFRNTAHLVGFMWFSIDIGIGTVTTDISTAFMMSLLECEVMKGNVPLCLLQLKHHQFCCYMLYKIYIKFT